MKGLLLKDFYMAVKYLRVYMLIFLVFAVLNGLGNQENNFLLFGSVMLSSASSGLISYDERFHWDRYCDTMPVSRGQVVLEKYLFQLAIVALGFGLASLVLLLSSRESILPWYAIPMGGVFVGLLMPSFLFPTIFALGSEQGRVGYYLVFFSSMLVVGFFSGYIYSAARTEIFGNLLIYIIPIVLYALSLFISIFFYKKREL